MSSQFRWKTAAGTLAIATVGGFLASLAGLPLPWLIGAQIALCIVALMRIDIFGAPPQWPRASRDLFLPVLGVMIGTSFSAEVLEGIPQWWPSLLALSAFIVVVHGIVFFIFRRIGGYDNATAFFASFPGGFVEATILGEEAGGNQQVIVIQHFLRISLIVFLVPLIFWAVSGTVVGSAAGVTMGGVTGPARPVDFAVLAVAGVVGTLVARRLRLPAKDISGAIAASAFVHIMGWADGALPPALIALTQLMIGTALGVGFTGVSRSEILRATGLAFLAFGLVFLGAVGCGYFLQDLTGTSLEALILSFAPGGLAEMSLIALSLHLSVPFVTLHHLYRIFFTVAVLPQLYRLIERGGAPEA
ncbi:AbrB family transcriptional regulator [Oricola thermophila]|uniref:AbrB family transcriptional regulator n=1 Tax=Oricola thermophila TaxID=2742145 RepID=A0A6N1VFD9_9HYPH|nr:AbrB family transcriptional regulator [Oricola thermophila]QKV19670.1 AbrB family transcriptional regulator [Oricola thermophila]